MPPTQRATKARACCRADGSPAGKLDSNTPATIRGHCCSTSLGYATTSERKPTRSSSTSDTRAQREYFSREAKKCTRRAVPAKATSTSPKSCCENSPGSPSKRTSGAACSGPDRRDELVERALAARVARQTRSAQALYGQDLGLPGELGHEQCPEGLDLRGPAHAAARALPSRIQRPHRRLSGDALDAAFGDPGELGHLRQPVPGPAQHLDLVSLQHVDHPFPRHTLRWRAFYPVPRPGRRGGQNFRKRSGQNFWNRQPATRAVVAMVATQQVERV